MKRGLCRCLAFLVIVTWRAAGEDNTTNILDGVTRDVPGLFLLGDTGSENFLWITNAGRLNDTDGVIGNAPAARNNQAVITGAGSRWMNLSNLIIGATGSCNRVSILAGGSAGVGWSAWLGLDPASTNNLLWLDGTNSTFDNLYLHLGYGGSGNRLIVTNGARLNGNPSRDTTDVIGQEPAAADNALVIVGPGSTARLDHFQIGAAGSGNRLRLAEGGSLTCSSAALGVLAGSAENSAEVLGSDTLWSCINGGLVVGSRGASNRLLLAEGARLSSGGGGLGSFATASNNVALLFGSRTLWSAGGEFWVGRSGPRNQLRITDGAALQASLFTVGSLSSDNLVLVDGAGTVHGAALQVGWGLDSSQNEIRLTGAAARWTNSGGIILGGSGSRHRLSVLEGASFRSDSPGSVEFQIGSNALSTANEVFVGPGSSLAGRWNVRVGVSGSGNRWTAWDGARLESSSATIGQNCVARENIAFLSGPGTVWSNGLTEIGFCSTNNQLILSNGARLFATLVRSSVQGGASNVIRVTGADSLLRAAGDLVVGNSGRGDLLSLAEGARAEGRDDRIGFSGGSTVATVEGPGTTWTNRTLTLGESGSGNRLTLTAAGRVNSGNATLGAGAKTAGNAVFVTDPGSSWTVASNLVVGRQGSSNRLSVAGGASVSAQTLALGVGVDVPGAALNSDGNVVSLDGTNSSLTVSSQIVVGVSGRFNRLEISGGARANTSDGIVGATSSATSNAVVVQGAGSTWFNANNLIVGSNGWNNEMTVAAGGRVVDQAGFLGLTGRDPFAGSGCFGAAESFSRVTVTGHGSVWENRGALTVGHGASGNQLILRDGGLVLANGLTVGRTRGQRDGPGCPPVTNRVTVDGGRLVVTNLTGNAPLEVRYGALELKRGSITADRLLVTNRLEDGLFLRGGTLSTFGGVIDSLSNTPPHALVGDGENAATLLLTGGTLEMPPALIVAPHATVAGQGEVHSASIQVFGTTAPGGRGFGRLALSGGFFSQSGDAASLSLDIGGMQPGISYDQFVTDSASFGGRLDVRLRGGFTPGSNDVFEIVRLDSVAVSFVNLTPQQRVLTADRLGSFRVLLRAPGIILADYRSTDLDTDGIEDAWAAQFFGHSPLTDAEKAADADGDGASNRDEFLAGTDPLSPASVFRVGLTTASAPWTIQFSCVPGKAYRVWYSDDLQSWREVADPAFHYLGEQCDWSDDGSATGGLPAGSRFYRVSVD